jgi:hypothetical protein
MEWLAGGGLVAALACAALFFWGRGWRNKAEGRGIELTQKDLDIEQLKRALTVSEKARADEKAGMEAERDRYEEEVRAVMAECTCGSGADRLNRLSDRPAGGGGEGGGPLPS